MNLVLGIILIVVALLVGIVIGFLIARKLITKQIKDNPPINEHMIRDMYKQMGRTASEKQIRQIMNSMNKHK